MKVGDSLKHKITGDILEITEILPVSIEGRCIITKDKNGKSRTLRDKPDGVFEYPGLVDLKNYELV